MGFLCMGMITAIAIALVAVQLLITLLPLLLVAGLVVFALRDGSAGTARRGCWRLLLRGRRRAGRHRTRGRCLRGRWGAGCWCRCGWTPPADRSSIARSSTAK